MFYGATEEYAAADATRGGIHIIIYELSLEFYCTYYIILIFIVAVAIRRLTVHGRLSINYIIVM